MSFYPPLGGRPAPVAQPEPFEYGPNYRPDYAGQLAQQILDDDLPTEYRPPWYEQTLTYRLPELVGPSAAQRARQVASMLGSAAERDSTGPGFPLRATLPLPWSGAPAQSPLDNAMNNLLGPGSALGAGLGMAPGSQRGGTISGPLGVPIATTPLTLSNFSAWGRERTLALITLAASGGKGEYQTPEGAVFGPDPNRGPANKGPVETLVDLFKVPFDAIFGVFEGAFEFWRTENAKNRALAVANLFATGSAIKNPNEMLSIDWITSQITGGGAKYDLRAIEQKAQERGIDWIDMMAEYYDLDPQIVGAIAANPAMPGDELRSLVHNAPLSRNPVVNMALEFSMQMATFMTPGGAAKLLRLGRGSGAAAQAPGFTRGLSVGERAVQAGTEASGLQRALQAGGWATRRTIQANSINTTAGWSIGGMEWGIKQIAALAGNQEVVDLMDRAMWEMPLSMNPGVNIMTAFGSHPLDAIKATRAGRVDIGKPGTLGYVGSVGRNGTIRVGGRAVPIPNAEGAALVADIRALDLDGMMPIFERLGWSREWVDRAFGPGNVDGLSLDDLREALLYTAMEAHRAGMGGVEAFQGINLSTLTERSIAFMERNIGPAHRVFLDELAGTSTKMADAFKGQWWKFADLNDTRQAEVKARLAETYDPGLAQKEFLSWVKASKVARDAHEAGLIPADVSIRLRQDVNLDFVRQFRAGIGRRYKPTDLVPTSELDELKRFGGMIEKRGRGNELVRGRKKVFKVRTRQQVDEILDSIIADEEAIRKAEAGPPREEAPIMGKGRTPDDPHAVTRVLGISPQSVEAIRAVEALPPDQWGTAAIPRDVLRRVSDDLGVTADALAANPAAAWPKIMAWFNERIDTAVNARWRRDRLDAIEATLKQNPALAGATAAADAVGFARDYLANPIAASYLARNSMLRKRITEATQALEQVLKNAEKITDDPIGRVAVEDLGEAGKFVVPRDVPGPYAAELVDVIRRADALNDADAALLADPSLHPFLKIDALRRAALADADAAIVEKIASADAQAKLEAVVKDILGPEAELTPQSAAQLVVMRDAWLGQVEELGGLMSAIGQRFRIIEGAGHAPDVLDLYQQLDAYQEANDVSWRNMPVRTIDAAADRTRAEKYAQREQVKFRVSKAEQELAEAEAQIANLTAPERRLDWSDIENDKPVALAKNKEQARAIRDRINTETGMATTWRKRKRGYGIYVGHVVEGVDEAPRTGAEGGIEQAMAAGDVEQAQALNIAEEQARGGWENPPEGQRVDLDAMRAQEAAPEPASAPETALEAPIAPEVAPAAVDDSAARLEAVKQELAAEGVDVPGVTAQAAPDGLLVAQPATYGIERPFDNPLDVAGEQVPARFKVVELEQLRVSGDEGYNDALQPRDRSRAASTSQIAGIVNKPKFERYLMSEVGSEGTPVVGPDNMTIAGNGRIKALREMSPRQIEQYKALLASRADEFGLTREQIDAMDNPVLVREIPDEYMTHDMAVGLNAATGGMSLTETGFAIARSLLPEDLDKLDLGESVSLRDALMAVKNQTFIQRVLGKLPEQDVRSLSDSTGALNADGLRVVQTALLAKVLPDRALVERFVESLDEGVSVIRSGIAEAIGQLTEATALIDTGTRGADLAIGPTLAEAVQRLIGVRERGLSPEDARLELTGTVGMFDAGGTQTAGELAWALYGIRSAAEVRDFLRAYVKAVKESPDPTQMGMFAEAPAQLVDVLNVAVKEVNGLRREKYNAAVMAKRAKEAASGQVGFEDAAEQVKPLVELPGFTDATGTIPARFQTEGGVEAIARDVPIIESPEAAIAARIAPVARVQRDGGALNPDTYAVDVPVDKIVKHDNEALALQSLYDDPEAALAGYERAFRGATSTEILFNRAAQRFSRGEATGSDYLILQRLSRDGLRYNEAGVFTGRLDTGAVLSSTHEMADLVRSFAGRGHRAGTGFDDVQAAVFEGMDAGPFERGSGVVADLTPEQNVVRQAAESGAQTFVKRGGALDEAARDKTGASRANPDSVLEINPPDEARLLRLATDRADAARARLAEQRAKLDEIGDLTPETEQVPIPREVYDLLWDYTNEPGTQLGGSAEFMGDAPTSVGQIVDVIESIDLGIPGLGRAMTEAEMATLRAGLKEWLDARLAAAPGKRGKPRTAAERKANAEPESLLAEPERWRDDVVKAWRALEHVVKPADGSPVTGYEGTQYDLGYLPTRGADGKLLSPRILPTVSLLKMLEKASPDLPAEIMMGAKQDTPSRIVTSRLAAHLRGWVPEPARRAGGLLARQFEANPERDLRAATNERFLDELVGPRPTGADDVIAAWEKQREQAAGIIAALHREMTQPENLRFGRFRAFRREWALGAARFERIARQHLAGDKTKYEFADLPDWAQGFINNAQNPDAAFFDAWAKADNRIRAWFAEQPNGASRYVEALYAHEKVRGASRRMSGLSQQYALFRFLMDGRWIALEMIEAPTLTLFREGPGAMLEAMGFAYKNGKLTRGNRSRPLFLGLDDLSRLREDFAYWAAADSPGAMLRYRENYILTLVSRRQRHDFPEVLRQMAERDPELMSTMRAFGDAPADWLERLDNSWQLYSQLSRKLKPEEYTAVYEPLLRDGTITKREYERGLMEAQEGRWHGVSVPAWEAEIAAAIGNPVLAPVMARMKFLSEQAWNDAAQLIYGQVDRSNVQRLLNHPLLYWPISYQIKAAKWLAGLMFDRFLGVDTGSAGALVLDRLHAQHMESLRDDPEYRRFFDENKTLLFAASMLFPITPWDIGVGISPFTRMAVSMAAGVAGVEDEPYIRNIFSFGPGYTVTNLLPRVGYELSKSPNDAAAGIGRLINQPFPMTVPVKPRRAPGEPTARARSTSEQTQSLLDTFGPGAPPDIPDFERPPQRYQEAGSP